MTAVTRKPHGGSGSNAGRKATDGAQVKRHLVTLDASTVERLKAPDLGDGELSIGIRRAASLIDLKTGILNPLHDHKGE